MHLDLPKEDPLIEGTRSEYHIGDTINVSCKAGPSKPAAQLMWFINDTPAPEVYLRELLEDTPIRTMYAENGIDNLKTSYLYLKFTADRYHFVNAMIKLRCTAVISQVFSRHQEVIARDEDKVRQSKTANYESDAPIITGVKQKYSVGDLVNATCTSRRSKPGAYLVWYINDVEVSKISMKI
ncbi:beat protein-like protein [Leptotrombidium deliense]|uniref:Beat protein-like protein n=1 Tax=Leptotrombidium deliense TaxID=299467 RepID=A0A443S021_9ACAR|nr:beat protein-like protein [Leptotrombidium deliense]